MPHTVEPLLLYVEPSGIQSTSLSKMLHQLQPMLLCSSVMRRHMHIPHLAHNNLHALWFTCSSSLYALYCGASSVVWCWTFTSLSMLLCSSGMRRHMRKYLIIVGGTSDFRLVPILGGPTYRQFAHACILVVIQGSKVFQWPCIICFFILVRMQCILGALGFHCCQL